MTAHVLLLLLLQVWLAAARPQWTIHLHRHWPPAFHAAARMLLLASAAAGRAGGGTAAASSAAAASAQGAGDGPKRGALAVDWGVHECEEVLRWTAYPLSTWLADSLGPWTDEDEEDEEGEEGEEAAEWYELEGVEAAGEAGMLVVARRHAEDAEVEWGPQREAEEAEWQGGEEEKEEVVQ